MQKMTRVCSDSTKLQFNNNIETLLYNFVNVCAIDFFQNRFKFFRFRLKDEIFVSGFVQICYVEIVDIQHIFI